MQGKGCTTATLRLDAVPFKGTTFTVRKQVYKAQFRAAQRVRTCLSHFSPLQIRFIST
jgi:hypothetical protein